MKCNLVFFSFLQLEFHGLPDTPAAAICSNASPSAPSASAAFSCWWIPAASSLGALCCHLPTCVCCSKWRRKEKKKKQIAFSKSFLQLLNASRRLLEDSTRLMLAYGASPAETIQVMAGKFIFVLFFHLPIFHFSNFSTFQTFQLFKHFNFSTFLAFNFSCFLIFGSSSSPLFLLPTLLLLRLLFFFSSFPFCFSSILLFKFVFFYFYLKNFYFSTLSF